MRLLLTILATGAALAISLATIHFYGLGQTYHPFQHKFLSRAAEQTGPSSKLMLFINWEHADLYLKIPDLILVAQVYKNKDGLFMVAPSNEKKIRDRSATNSSQRPLLKDFLKSFPTQRLTLEITDNVEDIDLELSEALKPEAQTERILIQSNYNLVLESVKRLMPMMIYGSTMSDTMRFKSFQSLGIVTATPFKGDLYFTPLRVKNRAALTPEIGTELKRRYKPIVLGPLYDLQQVDLAQSLGADGLYFENPDVLLQWLSQHPR